MAIRDLLSTTTPTLTMPRLTRSATVQAIAQDTGEDPSRIQARLDKEARKKLGKREKQNRNPIGSTEFAIRYAVQKLGMGTVSHILGVGESVLYKALNASDSARKLPEIGWARMVSLVGELRKKGHTEFFSAAIKAQGDAAAGDAIPQLPSLHHALTITTLAQGDVARAVALATDPEGDGGADITAAEAAEIIDTIARQMEAMSMLQGQVLAAAKTKDGAH
jgi:hypothetical protein